MRVTRRSETELLVQDSTLWMAVVCGAAAVLLLLAVALKGNRSGWVGAAVFLVCGVVWIRKTTFLFDSARRIVTWRRLAMLKTTTGTLSFDDITGVGEESSVSGTNGVQTYRLTLLLRGSSMPMSDSYSGGKHWQDKIRAQIQEFLGPATARSTLDDSVRSLLRQGRKVDAVSLVRTEERITLTEAVHRVESIEDKMKAEAAR